MPHPAAARRRLIYLSFLFQIDAPAPLSLRLSELRHHRLFTRFFIYHALRFTAAVINPLFIITPDACHRPILKPFSSGNRCHIIYYSDIIDAIYAFLCHVSSPALLYITHYYSPPPLLLIDVLHHASASCRRHYYSRARYDTPRATPRAMAH